ncbi:MAG: sugar ABC transporter ATP-binding protein [Planctomycetota bacterium]|nr:sugar ABC transporter ATP-binding protein [Planctomycetota bacterium]
MPLLTATNISKRFGVTQALDNVSVSFEAGEVHALMGENGAGKSTMGKVIAGLHKQDSGEVCLDGRTLQPGALVDAFHAGVRIVHQELAQCPNLSVAENLCLHDMPLRAGRVDRRAMNERAALLVHRLEPDINVEAPLGSLPPGRRQIVQIAASLDDRSERGRQAQDWSSGRTGVTESAGGLRTVAPSRATGASERAHASGGPRVIVFDEPTSSLAVAEVDRLLEIIRQLAREGITIIYVSHRMGEIFAVCDRVSVLRDGKFVATTPIKQLDEPALVEQMIGRKLEVGQKRAPRAFSLAEKPRLKVEQLSSPGKIENIALEVRSGEILGLGGLVGSGRSEVLDAIFGLDPRASGSVLVEDAKIPVGDVHVSIEAGVGYVPEDRRLQGLFFDLGIDENILVPFMGRLASLLGVRRSRQEREVVTSKIQALRVKAASHASRPGELSGGNQQKLLIARWLGPETRVLLLDEPTRGIDVGTKAEIYRLVKDAADQGLSVLLVSSEMPELLALSDRILVMAGGRISGELRGDDMTQANILRLATKED